jgi:hypothetical protein
MKKQKNAEQKVIFVFKSLLILFLILLIGIIFLFKNKTKAFSVLLGEDKKTNFKINSKNQAVPEENFLWLNHLRVAKKGILKDARIVTRLEGKVVAKSEKEGILKDIDYRYLRRLIIESKNGDKNIVYFSPKRTKVMKIYKLVNDKKELIAFNQIPLNSYVIIEEWLDLLKSSYKDQWVISLKIIVKNEKE